MVKGVCFECGKAFMNNGQGPIFVEVDYHGSKVKMHKACAKNAKEDKSLTAALPVEGAKADD